MNYKAHQQSATASLKAHREALSAGDVERAENCMQLAQRSIQSAIAADLRPNPIDKRPGRPS